MGQFYKKPIPSELFITTLNEKEQKWMQEDDLFKKNHTSGNEFMDKLADLVNRYGMQSAKKYEEMLSLKAGTISSAVLACSEMKFINWRNEYVMLSAKELLFHTDYKIDVIAKRIGFSGITTFSKWFYRLERIYPYRWRQISKNRLRKIEKEMLLKAKAETKRPSFCD